MNNVLTPMRIPSNPIILYIIKFHYNPMNPNDNPMQCHCSNIDSYWNGGNNWMVNIVVV